MKNKEIRELTPDELRARKRELREQIFHLRLQQAGGQLEKPSELRSLRREVARIETVLTQKNNSAVTAAKCVFQRRQKRRDSKASIHSLRHDPPSYSHA